MVVGFPEGTPLRRAVTFAYYRVEGLQFLRTTYKAGPLVALALACLGGLAAAELRAADRRADAAACGRGGGRAWRSWWPPTGPPSRASCWTNVWPTVRCPAPGSRRRADVDRMPPRHPRAGAPGPAVPVLPLGGTQDPILAALTKRPVTARSTVPYSDLHAADLLYTTDNLVQQRRLVPGQLTPLLELMSVGTVVTGSDDDRDRSGSAEPLGVVDDFVRQRRLRSPDEVLRTACAGSAACRATWAAAPRCRGAPLRPGRAAPDGAGRAAWRARRQWTARPRRWPAWRLSVRCPGPARWPTRATAHRPSCAAPPAREARVVIGDGNRRRVFTAARARQDHGPTVAASDPLSDRFGAAPAVPRPRHRRPDGGGGARRQVGPGAATRPASPSSRRTGRWRRSTAARATYWVADRYLPRERRYIDIDFGRPVNVDRLDLLPKRESNTDLTEVEIAGKRYPLHRGWNPLRPGLGRVRSLRVRVTAVKAPNQIQAGPGAIAEIRIPGVRVSDRLRPPRLAEKAAARHRPAPGFADLPVRAHHGRRSLPAFAPSRSRPRLPCRSRATSTPRWWPTPATASRPSGGRSTRLRRAPTGSPPGRPWRPAAADAPLDRLAGYRGPVRVAASARWQSRPRYRGSAAFDGRDRTAWVAPLRSPRASLSWSLPRAGDGPAADPRAGADAAPARPPRSGCAAGGRRTGALAVGRGGGVRLPRPARGREFTPADPARAAARPAAGPRRRGIAELRGAGVPARSARRRRPRRPARAPPSP